MKLGDLLTVDDFTKMFNVNKNGEFSTSDEKTHGQLQLKNGKLVNVNRYDRGKSNGVENTGKATADNFLLRNTLVSALRAEGASASFLEETRKQLGLKPGDVMAKPLSRRQVKQILRDFKAKGKVCKDKTDYPPRLFSSLGRFGFILNPKALLSTYSDYFKQNVQTMTDEAEKFFKSFDENTEITKADVGHLLESARKGSAGFRDFLERLGSMSDSDKADVRKDISILFGQLEQDLSSNGKPFQRDVRFALQHMLLKALGLFSDEEERPVQGNADVQQQRKIDNEIVADEPEQIVRPQVKRPESFDFKVEQPKFFPISTNEFLTIVNKMDQKANQMLEDLSKLKFPCLKGKDYGTACSKRLEDFKDGISYLQNLLRSQRLGLATNRNINEAMMKDFQSQSFERHEMYLQRISDFCVAELREFNELEEFNG